MRYKVKATTLGYAYDKETGQIISSFKVKGGTILFPYHARRDIPSRLGVFFERGGEPFVMNKDDVELKEGYTEGVREEE